MAFFPCLKGQYMMLSFDLICDRTAHIFYFNPEVFKKSLKRHIDLHKPYKLLI